MCQIFNSIFLYIAPNYKKPKSLQKKKKAQKNILLEMKQVHSPQELPRYVESVLCKLPEGKNWLNALVHDSTKTLVYP